MIAPPKATLSLIPMTMAVAISQALASGYCPDQPSGKCPKFPPAFQLSVAREDELIAKASFACRKVFGSTSIVKRIDRASRYIYCQSHDKERQIERIKYNIGHSSKPKSQIVPTTPPTPSPSIDPSVEVGTGTACPNELDGICASPPSTPTPPAGDNSDQRKAFLERAQQICIDQYGPLATLKEIDYVKWEVVCNKAP